MIWISEPDGHLRLMYGPHDLKVEAFGLTVGELRGAYHDFLSLGKDVEAYLNGRRVGFNMLTRPGDRLEFMKPFGRKGAVTYDVPNQKPYWLICDDALNALRQVRSGSVNCCVTSPPYFGGQRDYGVRGQLGQEPTIDEYVHNLVEVFRQVRRVLTRDGTLWLVIGDKYSKSIKQSGFPARNLIGVPWKVAFALQESGWFLRRDIIWQKPNQQPYGNVNAPSVEHEYVFMLSKSYPHYYGVDDLRVPYKSKPRKKLRAKTFAKSIRLGNGWHGTGTKYIDPHPDGRNIRTVWSIPTAMSDGDHSAMFPSSLQNAACWVDAPRTASFWIASLAMQRLE